MKNINIRLSVIVPVFNEEKTIGTMLKALLSQKVVDEIVVVDDCSTDNTSTILKNFALLNRKISIITHDKNLGKGGAVRSGLTKVSGEYTLIQDADLEYDPREIDSLLKPALEGKAPVIYGSRFTGPRLNMFYWHMLGNKFLNSIVNILYNTTLSDFETCYKLIKTDILKDLDLCSNDFAIEPEITSKILKRKLLIYEVPISYTGRTFAEGKKITWKDGLRAVYVIFKIKFSRRGK